MARGTTVTLRKSTARLNPQDLSAITCWIGCTSKGTVNVMQTLTQASSMRSTVGYGPAASGAAECLNIGGAPVYVTPSAQDNPGVIGTTTKTPASAGVAYPVYGSKLLPGADANGNIRFQGLVLGASLIVQAGGALAASVASNQVTLTIPAATAASAVETFWLSADPGATAARAKVSATFLGTKASNAGTTLAEVFFDNGGIFYTPPATGYRVKHTTGVSTGTTTASYATNDLTVDLGTDAQSNPNDPASDIVTAVNAITGRITASPIGNGTGTPGILAAFQALQYGSTAALVLSGSPTDYIPNLHIECVSGGALGAAQIKWTVDGQVGVNGGADTRSSTVLVPVSGVVVLEAANFESGITATFTGVLETDDYWDSSATAPTSSTLSLIAAATAAINDPTRKFGVLALAQPLALTAVQAIDSLIQTKWGTKFVECIAPIRDRTLSGGVYTETDADFVNAINAEFLAFSSVHGLTLLAPAGTVFTDNYTGYTYGLTGFLGETLGRPAIIPAVARNSAIPVHESLGRVATGSIRNVSGISHDERLHPGLVDKFLVTQSYDERPGQQFFAGCATTADPGDPAFTAEPWVSLACQVGRIAREAAFPYIQDTVETTTAPENNGAVPVGALTESQALRIEADVAGPIEAFLFKPKSDNRPSANRLPDVDESGNPLKTVTALRDFSVVATNELRLEVRFSRLGIIYSIDIGITLL